MDNISLIFLTTTRGHFNHKDIFIKTLTDWQNKNYLNLFQEKIAHIKVSPDEIHLGQDMSEAFNNFNFNEVIGTVDEWKHFDKSHFLGIINDLHRLSYEASQPYCFILEDDWLIHCYEHDLEYYINKSINLLEEFPDAMSVRFPRHKDDANHFPGTELTEDKEITKQGNLFSFNPTIVRTRDLYNALSLAKHNINIVENNAEVGMTYIYKNFSMMDKPFLTFNPQLVRALHIGTENVEQEDTV